MQTYLAFLRGINVGGKSMIKMAELRDALSAAGMRDVQTYIQSGNVICSAKAHTMPAAVGRQIAECITNTFKLDVGVAVFTKEQWTSIVSDAPTWWGDDPDWKHNILIVIEPGTVAAVVTAIGELKPAIERVKAGDGVVYQSMLFTKFGQTSSSKLASLPAYKTLTVRNYNTATKLLKLL